MTIEYKKGDVVVIINPKLDTFGQKGILQDYPRYGAAWVKHDGAEAVAYSVKSIAKADGLIQHPFEQIILDEIERRIPEILSSASAEEEIKMLGMILEHSILPEKRVYSAVKRLKKMARRLSSAGDERRILVYLDRITVDLDNDPKWPGDSA